MERFVETAADRSDNPWVSGRHLAELESEAKAMTFDKLIDAQRAGRLTMEEVVTRFKEEWPDE